MRLKQSIINAWGVPKTFFFHHRILFMPNGKQGNDNQMWNLKSVWWNLRVTGCSRGDVQTRTSWQEDGGNKVKVLGSKVTQWKNNAKKHLNETHEKRGISWLFILCIHCCKKYPFTPPTIWFWYVWYYTWHIPEACRRIHRWRASWEQSYSKWKKNDSYCARVIAVKLARLLSAGSLSGKHQFQTPRCLTGLWGFTHFLPWVCFTVLSCFLLAWWEHSWDTFCLKVWATLGALERCLNLLLCSSWSCQHCTVCCSAQISRQETKTEAKVKLMHCVLSSALSLSSFLPLCWQSFCFPI